MADQQTLQTYLAEAEAAHHRLSLGEAVVTITRDNGDEVTFQQTNLGKLKRYIQSLKRQLGQKSGTRILG